MIYEDKTAGEVSVNINSGRSDVINFTQILLAYSREIICVIHF